MGGWPAARHTGIRPSPKTIMPMLSSAGASAGRKNTPRAFSMPIAAAASATAGRNGSMMRVSVTVSASLPGTAAKPPAMSPSSCGAKIQPSVHNPSSTASSVDMS